MSPATRPACSVPPVRSDAIVTMKVPFLDLRGQHEPLMRELDDAFREVTPV